MRLFVFQVFTKYLETASYSQISDLLNLVASLKLEECLRIKTCTHDETCFKPAVVVFM